MLRTDPLDSQDMPSPPGETIRLRREIVFATIPACAALLGFWPLVVRDLHTYGQDDLEFTVPFALFLRRSLLGDGAFPLFNPYTDSGLSFFSRIPMMEPFYPTVLLFFLLPPGWALNVAFLLHVVLAAFGTFFFARSAGIGRLAATMPALIYPLSSIFLTAERQGYLVVAATWALLPFVLGATEAASAARGEGRSRSRRRWIAFGGLALGLLLLGGSPEQNYAGLMVWALWNLLCWVRDPAGHVPGGRKDRLLAFAAIALLGGGVGMAFWLPACLAITGNGGLATGTGEFLGRRGWEFANYLLALWNRGGKESACMGVSALYLALVSARVAGRVRLFMPAALLCALFLLLSAGDLTPAWSLLAEGAPLFTAIDYPYMFSSAAIFFGALLAGIALDAPRPDASRPRLPARFVPLAVLILLLTAVATIGVLERTPLDEAFPRGTEGRRWGAAWAAGCLLAVGAVVLGTRWKDEVKGKVLLSIVALDLLAYHGPAWLASFEPVRDPEYFRARPIKDYLAARKEPFRLFPLEVRIPEPHLLFKRNESLIAGIETIPIGGHLPRRSYFDMLARMRGLSADWRDFSDRRPAMQGNENLVDDPWNVRILDLLNTRFVLTDGAELARENLVMTWEEWRLYERPSALARASLVFDWEQARDEDDCYDKTLGGGIDLARTALLYGDARPAPFPAPGKGGSVAIEGRRPGVLRIQTAAEERALLLVSEIWDASWRARVDGQPVETHVADCLLTGIFLDPGSHSVDLEFQPQGLVPGAVVSLASLAVILGMLGGVGSGRRPSRAGGEPPATRGTLP